MTDLLLTVAIDGLGKIAHLVEQPDSHEGQADVTGRFAVIAGQNTESAGINRKAFVKTELQAEVGDQVLTRVEQFCQLRAAAVFPVGIIGSDNLAVILHGGAIVDGVVQSLL